MTIPEILFTHCIAPALSLVRNRLAIVLRTSHHRTEPVNTPRTSTMAEP